MSAETIVELSEYPTEHIAEPNSEREPNFNIESSFEQLSPTDQFLPDQDGDTLPEPILDSSTIPSSARSIFESTDQSTDEFFTELATDSHSASSTAHPSVHSTRPGTPETLLARGIDTPQYSPSIHQAEDGPPTEFAFEEKGSEFEGSIGTAENTRWEPNPEPSNLECEGDTLEEIGSEGISFEAAQEPYTNPIEVEEFEQGREEIEGGQGTIHTETDTQSVYKPEKDPEPGFETPVEVDIEEPGEQIVCPESISETESLRIEEQQDPHIPLDSEPSTEEEREVEASSLDYSQNLELALQEELVVDHPLSDAEEEVHQIHQAEQDIVPALEEEQEFDQPESDIPLEDTQSLHSEQDTASAFKEISSDQARAEEQAENSKSPEPEQGIATVSDGNVSDQPVPDQEPEKESEQVSPEEEIREAEQSVHSEVDQDLEEHAQPKILPELVEAIPGQDTESQDLCIEPEPEPESSIVVIEETHLDTCESIKRDLKSTATSEADQEELEISFHPTITEVDQPDLEPSASDTQTRFDLELPEEPSQEATIPDNHTDEIKETVEDLESKPSAEQDLPVFESDSITEPPSPVPELETHRSEEELNSAQDFTASESETKQPIEEAPPATELNIPVESEPSIAEQQPPVESRSASVCTAEPSPEPTRPNTPKMAVQERSAIASQLSDALALFTSFDDAVKTLVSRLQSTENNMLATSLNGEQSEDSEHIKQTPSTPFNVPYPRNPNFHGRFSILSRLFGMWRPQQRCRIIVAGLGGVGKTELVVEFIYRARQVSPVTPIFWFGPNDIRPKDASISTNPGLQLEDWIKGSHSRGSLLVIDVGDRSDLFVNASDHGTLIDQLSAFEGTVIMVTRNARHGAAFARPHEICEVNELEIEACVSLLCENLESFTHDTSTEKEFQEVVKSLYCFPRAIIQVAKLLNSTEMSIAQFLEMFSSGEAFKLRLLGRIEPWSQPDHDLSVIGRGVFDLRSFRRGYGDQSRLLYQLYYLGGTSVPCKLVSIDDPLNKLLLMLVIKAHFMISEDASNQTFTIHPMVYLAMRKALGSERSLSDEHDMLEERKWYDDAVLAFSKHYPDASVENRGWWKECFTHLITGYKLHTDAVRIAIAKIYHSEFLFFKRKGSLAEALKMASLAKSVLPDPVPSECLVIIQDQVTLLDFLARYREVHEMLRGLSMEVGHPGALWKKRMLAKLDVADCANRYESAIDMFRQVRMAGEASSANKLDLANATDDLAVALMHKGKYKEAASECKKALSERTSRLGNSHTDTLSSCHNMAEILMKDGKFEDAMRYVGEAIHGRENVLGLDHPETLHSSVLRARIQVSKAKTTAQFDEAEAVLIHAMDKLSVKLSPEHPIVMTCKSEIARIMFARGKYETAEQMNQAVLTAREQGPWLEPTTHPDTMTSRNQLAEVIQLKDGSKAADNLSERCLTERTVVLTNGTLSGDDFHPDQLASLHARAVVLSGLGQHLAALQKIDLALLGRKAVLGDHHPDYFVSMTWKGEIMRSQLHRYQSERTQTLDTIENLHKQAYEGLSWILGSEHHRALQAATHMALAKRERGGPASSEAEGLFRQIHCAYQHNMGDFHPETCKAKGRLAEAMRAASPRHHLEAKKLWRDSCGGLTRIYGFDAHVTANAYKGYEKFMKTYPDP